MNKKNLISISLFVVLLAVIIFFGIRTEVKLNRLTRIEINKSTLENSKRTKPRLAIIPKGDNPTIGTDSAKVKMIVFIDYQCGFCRAFVKERLPILKEEYVSKGLLQITFRDYPLNFHDKAELFAQVGHLMSNEGRFESFLSDVWDLDKDADSTEVFNSFGIEKADPVDCAVSQNKIRESKFLAGVAGITATPTVIINDRMIAGLRSMDELRSIIDYSIGNTLEIEQTNGACGQ